MNVTDLPHPLSARGFALLCAEQSVAYHCAVVPGVHAVERYWALTPEQIASAIRGMEWERARAYLYATRNGDSLEESGELLDDLLAIYDAGLRPLRINPREDQ